MITNTYIGRNAQSFEKSPSVTVDRVIVKVDDENNYYSPSGLTQAQWDAMTGKIITVSIPFGTQAIADGIRATLSARPFLPYKASFSELDPAAELGDWVTVDGIYSVVAKRTFSLNDLGSSEISADTENTVTDKYPYLSKAEAEVQMKLASVSARLTVAEGAITSEVTARADADTALGSRITQNTYSISAEVTARTNADSALQTAINGKVAASELNAKIGAYIDTEAGTAKIDSKVSGTYLKKTDASDTYETKTNVASITQQITKDEASIDLLVDNRGTASASIKVSAVAESAASGINSSSGSSIIKIKADHIQMTGTTTFLTASDVGSSGSTTISGDRITTGTISASRIGAGTLTLGDNTTNGMIYLKGSTYLFGYSGGSTYITSGDVQITASDGKMVISADEYIRFVTGNGQAVRCQATSLIPWTDGSCGLGYSNYRWGQIYSTSSTILTSDRKEKKDINYNIDDMDSFFDSIKPCSYKFVYGNSGRTHYGMISQDVEDSLITEGKTALDFAGFCKDKKTQPIFDEDGNIIGDEDTGEYRYGIRYEEFIALCISQIQKLKARVTELEATIN